MYAIRSYYEAEDIDNIFVQAEEKYGHVDVLVNNAGIWPTTPIEKMSDDEWKKVVDIDLTGTFMFSKRAAIHFLKHDVKGHIVSISSRITSYNVCYTKLLRKREL